MLLEGAAEKLRFTVSGFLSADGLKFLFYKGVVGIGTGVICRAAQPVLGDIELGVVEIGATCDACCLQFFRRHRERRERLAWPQGRLVCVGLIVCLTKIREARLGNHRGFLF